jgi:hypothetical protein
MSTPNKVLAALADANGYISLGLQVGAIVIPLVKGLVKKIESIGAGQETVSYQVLLQVDASELDAIEALAVDDLTAINAELVARGIAPLPLPPATPPTQ